MVLGVSPEAGISTSIKIKEFPYSEYKELKKLQRHLPAPGAIGLDSPAVRDVSSLPSSSEDDDPF